MREGHARHRRAVRHAMWRAIACVVLDLPTHKIRFIFFSAGSKPASLHQFPDHHQLAKVIIWQMYIASCAIHVIRMWWFWCIICVEHVHDTCTCKVLARDLSTHLLDTLFWMWFYYWRDRNWTPHFHEKLQFGHPISKSRVPTHNKDLRDNAFSHQGSHSLNKDLRDTTFTVIRVLTRNKDLRDTVLILSSGFPLSTQSNVELKPCYKCITPVFITYI